MKKIIDIEALAIFKNLMTTFINDGDEKNNEVITLLNNRVQALEMMNSSEVSTNPFVITFANLDGLAVEDGVWNDTQVRMEY